MNKISFPKVAHISGRYVYCHCPYHSDTNPSLAIRITEEDFGQCKCYSCGRKGKINKNMLDKIIKNNGVKRSRYKPISDWFSIWKETRDIDIHKYSYEWLEIGMGIYRGGPFSIPMYDLEDKKLVFCGLQLRDRLQGGRKWTVPGSSLGVFLNVNSFLQDKSNLLFILEGPSDLACFNKHFSHLGKRIARPSCNSCTSLIQNIVEMYHSGGGKSIFVIGDNDKPGIEGANRLADKLGGTTIYPEQNDFSDWVYKNGSLDVEIKLRESIKNG